MADLWLEVSDSRNAGAARISRHGKRVHDIWIVVAARHWVVELNQKMTESPWQANSIGIVSPVDYITIY